MVDFPGLTIPEAAAPESSHLPAEARLWLAVVCQAIVDASSRGAMAHEQLLRAEARRWLTEPSAGLHAVLTRWTSSGAGGTAGRSGPAGGLGGRPGLRQAP